MALRQALLAATGSGFLVLAIAGMFLPLLPTTPFLLVASACLARSSPRLHARLLAHPRLGPMIRAFEQGEGLTRRAKSLAATMIWASMVFAIPALPAFAGQVGLLGVAILVSAWITAMPTLDSQRPGACGNLAKDQHGGCRDST